jgi:DNA-binding response OmpR family regulator
MTRRGRLFPAGSSPIGLTPLWARLAEGTHSEGAIFLERYTQQRPMVRHIASVLAPGVAMREGRTQLRAGSALSLGQPLCQRRPGFEYVRATPRRELCPQGSRLSSALESLLNLLLLTDDPHPNSVLPSLALLSHAVRSAPTEASSLLHTGAVEVAIVDARTDVATARGLCHLLGTTGTSVPVVAVVNEGALVAVNVGWGLDEILLPSTGPAEIDVRLRLLVGRRDAVAQQQSVDKIRLGEMVIDAATYTVQLRERPIHLTYKEFELLKYLVQHAGRVFTRRQLLQEVWGYDFLGGTRTVDVHVRRLRAKLGPEHESLIGTVRNVGYKAVRPARGRSGSGSDSAVDRDHDRSFQIALGDNLKQR